MNPIAQQLLDLGIISQDQLHILLMEQKQSGEQLGDIAVRLGFASLSVIQEVLSYSTKQSTVDLKNTIVQPQALELISQATAKRFKVMPISYHGANKQLTLAIQDVLDFPTLDRISAGLDQKIQIKAVLATNADIEAAIDQFYGYELSVDGILEELESTNLQLKNRKSDDNYSQPTVRLVDAILADAVKNRASDIHFEPERGFLRIRYRIDGVMQQIRVLHHKFYPPIQVRLKVMSNINISESRLAQDGRMSLKIAGRDIDFRVATQPTIHGENIVLRILDRERGIIELKQLGVNEDNLQQLNLMMAKPEGVILLTGPTGSGKTTTLYSMLSSINNEKVNIMTLEDPVEYPLPMIRQTNVNEAVNLNFGNGIRSILRQDPDIILVGEIRDEDTAKMTFRAAMTGHQVYTTLHTNSALAAIARLKDLGVSEDLLSGNIIGIVAQRLLRKLCNNCKQAYRISQLELDLLKLDDAKLQLFKATGCQKCANSGYHGRFAVVEVVRFDQQFDALIAQRATLGKLQQYAATRGFKNLLENGIEAVISGKTSSEELTRVVDMTARV